MKPRASNLTSVRHSREQLLVKIQNHGIITLFAAKQVKFVEILTIWSLFILMKNRFIANQLLLFRVLVLSIFALASQGLLAENLKIGVVSAATVLEEAPQMEVARKALENEFAPRNQELVGMEKKLRNQEEKLNRDGDIMSEAERRKLERDIRSRARELKRLKDEFNEDLNLRRNEAFDRIRRKVLDVVTAIGKKEKFDLIVNDGVLYASDRVNITNAVIQQLKSEQKNTAQKSKK